MSGAPHDDGPWMDYREFDPANVGQAGTIYDGVGRRLAGPGPARASELVDVMPHRLVIHDEPRMADFALLTADDCIWALPDTFGMPPEPPMRALRALASFIRQGGAVGLASRDLGTLALAHGVLVQVVLWGAPRPRVPANPYGTIYDGAGERLIGGGPTTVTLAKLNAHPFRTTLGQNEVLARGGPFGREDRLWLLPRAFAPPKLPMDLLQDLVSRLKQGRRIGLASSNQAFGEFVAGALRLAYVGPQGSA